MRWWPLGVIPGVLGVIAIATASAPTLHRVKLSQLDVTEGELVEMSGHRLRINGDRMRAVAREPGQHIAELRFTYLGPTSGKPLLSGELRRQIGVKLLARDTCNVLYVMWRIEPEPKLSVQVKSNIVFSSHEDCLNHGYVNIKPRRSRSLEAPEIGKQHILRAELSGSELRVYADGTLVWEGGLGSHLVGLEGPAGMRSDNGRFDLQLYVDDPDHS
jgi:hypothetical protein